jgi:hypothetical protein
MIRTTLATSAMLFALAMPALAGSPPVKGHNTTTAVTDACAELGAAGESLSSGGTIGCRNTATGAAVTCNADGQCTDYFADPRYGKIKAALEGAKQQAPVRL